MKDFIKDESDRLKIRTNYLHSAERRQKRLKKEKKKGSDSRNHHDPKRLTEIKRLFESKKKELESQEAKLLLKFLETYPGADVMMPCIEMLWAFLTWLKEKAYHVIDERDVFCVPFSHLVRYKNLK